MFVPNQQLLKMLKLNLQFQTLTARHSTHQWMVEFLVTPHSALLNMDHCVRLNVTMVMNSQEVDFFGVLHCLERLKDTGTVMMLDVKVRITNISCRQTNRHSVWLQETICHLANEIIWAVKYQNRNPFCSSIRNKPCQQFWERSPRILTKISSLSEIMETKFCHFAKGRKNSLRSVPKYHLVCIK